MSKYLLGTAAMAFLFRFRFRSVSETSSLNERVECAVMNEDLGGNNYLLTIDH